MKRWPAVMGMLLAWALLLGARGCGGVIVPPGPPQPPPTCPTCTPGSACTDPALGCQPIPPPGPPCQAGQYYGCWDLPAGSGWVYVCPVYDAAGHVIGTINASDPTQCPAKPASPPTPPPEPPPVTPGCSIDGEPGPLLPDHRPILGSQVNAAMVALRPDCDPGGRCVLEESRQEWQARAIAELRRRGVCSGQHEPTTDEIAAASSVSSPREGWHVYAGPWDGPGTVVWSPQAARQAYSAPATPPPPTEACPAPLPDRTRLYLHLTCGSWCDTTVQTVGTLAYCEAIGMSPMADGTLRASCPMRSECPGYQCESRPACELYALGGAYEWKSFPAWRAIIPHPTNPALARCDGCDRLRVCSADGPLCSDWVVP